MKNPADLRREHHKRQMYERAKFHGEHDQSTHNPHGGGGSSERDAARGSEVVRSQRAVEQRMREESQWQRLMTGKHDEAVNGMTKAEAKGHLDRLNAAPGDNKQARAVLEARVRTW